MVPGTTKQFEVRRIVPAGGLVCTDLTSPYEYPFPGAAAAVGFQVHMDRLMLPVDVIERGAAKVRSSPLYELVTRHLMDVSQKIDLLSELSYAPHLRIVSVELMRALLTSAAGHGPDADEDRAVLLVSCMRGFVRQYVMKEGRPPDETSIGVALAVSLKSLRWACAQSNFDLGDWLNREHGQTT